MLLTIVGYSHGTIDVVQAIGIELVATCIYYLFCRPIKTTASEEVFLRNLKEAEIQCEVELHQVMFAEQDKLRDFNRALSDWCQERGLHYEGAGCTCQQCNQPKVSRVYGLVADVGPQPGSRLAFNGTCWENEVDVLVPVEPILLPG